LEFKPILLRHASWKNLDGDVEMMDCPDTENNNTKRTPQEIKSSARVWCTDKIGNGMWKSAIWVKGRHFVRIEGLQIATKDELARFWAFIELVES
jgi:hypothetical protein